MIYYNHSKGKQQIKRKEVLKMIWFLFSSLVATYNMVRFAKTDNIKNILVCAVFVIIIFLHYGFCGSVY